MGKKKNAKIVPKRIGRVKVPKGLRRMVNSALANPMVREMVSGALVTLAAALAKREAQEGSTLRSAVSHPMDGAQAAASAGKPAADTLQNAAGLASRIVEEVVEALRGEQAIPADAPQPDGAGTDRRSGKRTAQRGAH